MDYAQALRLADDAKATLSPYCTRIEIAGSVRRQKDDPRDIELVCIPHMVTAGLFDDGLAVSPDFCAAVNRWHKVKGEPTGKYTQRVLPGGMKLDLFMADTDNFGTLFLIRTGDWEFSKHFMGWVLPRHGYKQQDGYIWKDGAKVPVPEEQDVFALAGMEFIEPSKRTGNGRS
jgi:DNA polymerase/3'-5' exonuclease PolX